ncbi:MAG TPA: VOC family protein [Candidatus Dormibacteraeota bacterium]|nr:VOC family protein [Candidatus Dormibacteraeota bacterium]
MQLFRVIIPVRDVDAAARFYAALLSTAGERVSTGRHYFKCGAAILACWDALADGDPAYVGSNAAPIYLSTEEPLEAVRERAFAAGAKADAQRGDIGVRPWGERSFYVTDPWGNPLCLVQAGSEYLGGRINRT